MVERSWRLVAGEHGLQRVSEVLKHRAARAWGQRAELVQEAARLQQAKHADVVRGGGELGHRGEGAVGSIPGAPAPAASATRQASAT